jgi:hypothetical protein
MSTKLSLFFCLFLLLPAFSIGQPLPSPKEHFGFSIGDNYKLATYTQTEAYFKKIASVSDRVRLINMGLTEEGRNQYMMVVSSPNNLKNLERYREIARKMARADVNSSAEARSLALEGKAVVWIDGGLHATETVGTHQLIETLWQLVSRNDRETLRILDDVIILLAHANPDGQELVSNWYMNNPDTLKRSFSQLPRLYQKYTGHDNNRDFYMMNMKESQNISKQLYIEWMPQIIYNHHQSGPAGSIVAGPPYRDPFNYLFNPLVVTGIDAVGAAMINRLNSENRPGYTERGGAVFSTWYNGGLRTTSYFHNMIGILTEIIGNPTPSTVPLVPSRLLPSGNTPFPVMPQRWQFRKSIDYSLSLNYAVLDYAARNREHLLYNIYCMGNSSIQAGNRDNWSISPKRVEAIINAWKSDPKNSKVSEPATDRSGWERVDTVPIKFYQTVLKDLKLRDPRGYIIPSDQPDFPTAVKFVNALIRSGIGVAKASNEFTAGGKKYPAGSYIVKTNQAFRPHVLDMFEPQDHPNDFSYPGGPPVKPYDIAGWTPAYSMGIQFTRLLDAFDGPFVPIPYGEIQSPSGGFAATTGGAGYVLDSRCNNAYVAVNDLLQAGVEVYRCKKQSGMEQLTGEGSFFIPSGQKAKQLLAKASVDLGLKVATVSKRPHSLSSKLTRMRIALWDTYGGSIASGWMRWILEQHHFPFGLIYAQEINAGNLLKKYDVILFVSGAIPSLTPESGSSRETTRIGDIPAEFRSKWGKISADTSVVELKKFIEAGGVVLTIGKSTNLAYHLKLPVKSALMEMNKGKLANLPSDKYYIPGSILRVKVDSLQTAAWGMGSEADFFFDSSPVFRLLPEGESDKRVRPIAWFGATNPLRSGWAYGQEYLQDGVVAFEAKVGKGKLYAFGPEITFRAQTHGTFKFLFNQLFLGY